MTIPNEVSPLRLAVVGAGVIGRHHAKAALRQGDYEIAALIDDSDATAAASADALSAVGGSRPSTWRTIADALAATDIDVFAICTPSGLHVDLAEQAIDSGRHVLIEKPLDTTMTRGRRIAAAARAASDRGQVVGVVSQHRLDPSSQLVTETAHRGGFGTVTSGVASVAWYRSQDYYDSGDWRGTWDLDGGGAVSNQGVHTVDLLVWTMGEPVEVSAQTALLGHRDIEVEDVAVATVRFASGALGVIHCTTAAYPGLSARYAVYGTRGSAVVDDDRLAYFHAATADASLASASTTSGSQSAEGVDDQKDRLVPDGWTVDSRLEDDHFLSGHVRQYADFAEAVRTGRPPAVTVDAALTTLATVRALYASATLGEPVRVSDVLDGRFDDTVDRLSGTAGGEG